jgi:hypothetical protein
MLRRWRRPLVVQSCNLDEARARFERAMAKLSLKDETARRPMSIPGFEPINASPLAATIQDTFSFAGPREYAAFSADAQADFFRSKPKRARLEDGHRNLRKLLSSARTRCCSPQTHTDPLRM